MMVTNITTVSGFFRLGFSDTQELQILHALLFLLIYLLCLAGNFIIITITTLDPQLQSPTYFFLKHFSLLNLSSLTVTVPQSIHNSLTGRGYISYAQCLLQVFFFVSLSCGNLAILTVMSYDRYVAICLPLYYELIMGPKMCGWAVTAVWISGGISGTLYSVIISSIRFCRAKIIHQIFCDVPQLLKLSCSNDNLEVVGVMALLAAVAFVCFVAIAISYVQIFSMVLRMLYAEGQSKVFSTCLPHLLLVTCSFSTRAFAYLKPTSDSSTVFDFMLCIFYTVLPPTLNPIIYILRNETIRGAVRKLLPGGEFRRKKIIFILLVVVNIIHK